MTDREFMFALMVSGIVVPIVILAFFDWWGRRKRDRESRSYVPE
jgi:hypothetical protein